MCTREVRPSYTGTLSTVCVCLSFGSSTTCATRYLVHPTPGPRPQSPNGHSTVDTRTQIYTDTESLADTQGPTTNTRLLWTSVVCDRSGGVRNWTSLSVGRRVPSGASTRPVHTGSATEVGMWYGDTIRGDDTNLWKLLWEQVCVRFRNISIYRSSTRREPE